MIERAYKPVLSRDFGNADGPKIEHYCDHGGYDGARKALAMEPKEVIDLAKAANLRGRGGAGFPAGVKWGFVPADSPKPRYVCCNADESEPGTFKDRALMTWSPHMLIEGMIITAYAIGSKVSYIYIRGEYVVEAEILERAIAEAYDRGYLGKGIFGTGFDLELTVHRGAGAYICGEETALLSSLEGGRGYPKIKPPFPAVEGAFRCPTIVNNVETLCNVPHIFEKGVEWYLSIGPEKSPGPKLYCLSGQIKNPGLYEHSMNITLDEVLNDAQFGGGPVGKHPFKAVIPGGLSMPIFTAKECGVRMDFDSVIAAGSYLGAAGVIAMDESFSMVDGLYNVVRFYHHESCGQCTPCREGCGWVEKILARICRGQGRPEDIDLLLNIADQMTGTTICLLSDSCAMPMRSWINKFREEFDYICEHGVDMVKSGAKKAPPPPPPAEKKIVPTPA